MSKQSLNAEIIETNCTPEGKEYTFVTDEDVEIQGADYQWIDADTGLDATEVSEDPSAIFPIWQLLRLCNWIH